MYRAACEPSSLREGADSASSPGGHYILHLAGEHTTRTSMVRSTDGGETWHSQVTPHPYAGNGCAIAQTADDGLDHDMGYPSSVQLPDGSIFTRYD